MAHICCLYHCRGRSVGWLSPRTYVPVARGDSPYHGRVHHYCNEHLLAVKHRYKRKLFFHAYRGQ